MVAIEKVQYCYGNINRKHEKKESTKKYFSIMCNNIISADCIMYNEHAYHGIYIFFETPCKIIIHTVTCKHYLFEYQETKNLSLSFHELTIIFSNQNKAYTS